MKHIPLNIITLALRENKVNQLKLFVYLKKNSSGILKIDNEYIKANYEALGYKTHKTFKNNLQRLLNDNWVGYNPKTGIYFIRSYKYFGESTKFYFKDEYFKDFRGFLSACVVKKVCNNMMYCKNGAAKGETAKQRSTDKGHQVANTYLSKAFGFSVSKSKRVKRRMVQAGLGQINKQYYLCNYKCNLTGEVKPFNYFDVKHLRNEIDANIFYKGGNVWIVSADRCVSYVSVIRRKKVD